jgi:DNA-binding phage protein
MNEKHLGISFAPFDAADYLDDEETIAEYLAAALEDPNPDVLRAAVQDVLRARIRAQDVATDRAACLRA